LRIRRRHADAPGEEREYQVDMTVQSAELRDPLVKYHIVDDFRWRSREVSRIEGFSDAVFGFAVTLLIVSLEVPHTSTELLETMHSFLGFVVTFFMLASIWYSQFIFFRRYGLEDRLTVILNLALLFTVLFFVRRLTTPAGLDSAHDRAI